MLKKFVAIAALICMLTLAFSGGCYITDGGSEKEIVGTYKLERKTLGTDESGSAIDIIAQQGIKEYLVIGSDGYGYSVYGDNDTPITCKQLMVKLIPDEENPETFVYVEYNDKKGGDPTKLGYFNKGKRLNYGTPHINSGCIQVEQSSISYAKISDKTDLSAVAEELGFTPEYTPYELNGYMTQFSGYKSYMAAKEGEPGINSPYIYYIIDTDFSAGTADLYFALTSDRTAQSIKDVALSWKKVITEQGYDMEITINSVIYKSYVAGSLQTLISYEGNDYYYYFDSCTIDDIPAFVTNEIEAYNLTFPIEE